MKHKQSYGVPFHDRMTDSAFTCKPRIISSHQDHSTTKV